MTKPASHLRIFPTLLGYGALGVPLAMLTGPVFVALPTWLVADLGVSQAAVGIALLLARLWDGLCDPVAGWLSDRSGQRRIWILLGLPITLLGAWGLLTAEAGITPLEVGLWSMVLYTGWTLIKLNHDAWGAELSPDYTERVRVTAAREGAILLGGVLAIGLIGWSTLPGSIGLGQAYTILFWVLVAALPLGVALLLITAPARIAPVQPHISPRDALNLLRDNRHVRQFCGAFALNSLAGALPATLFLLFVDHGLGRPDLRGPLIMLYFVSAIVAVPLWVWAGRRFGKHQAWRVSIMIAAMAFMPVFFLGPGLEIQFAIICVITGVCLGGDVILPPAIQADVADEIRLETGKDQTGMLFALLNLISKLALAGAVGLAFPLLAAVGFGQSAGAANSTTALGVLAALYALAPAVLKLAAAGSLRGFTLDQARQEQVQLALAARHKTQSGEVLV